MTEKDVKLPYKIPTFYNWSPQATFYHPLHAGSIDGTDLYPHDKGVVRAMISRYKPNKSIEGDQSKTLFVGRLSKDTTQDAIQKLFEEFGELEKCRLVRDFGFSRGYAFVEFKRKKDALLAAAEMHRMAIDGKKILVDFECERILEGWKPRRFGGGFGGRKESGQLRFGGIDRPFKRPLPDNIDRFGWSRDVGVKKDFQDQRGHHGEHDRKHNDNKGDSRKYERNSKTYSRDRDRDSRRDHRGYHKDHDKYEREQRHRDQDFRNRENRDKMDREGYDRKRSVSDRNRSYERNREDHRGKDDNSSMGRHKHDRRQK